MAQANEALKIFIGKNVRDNKPTEAGLDEVMLLFKEQTVHVKSLRNNNLSEEQREELKKNLPYVMWQGRPTVNTTGAGYRKEADIHELTGLVMVDFDHLPDPRAMWEEKKDQACALGCCFAHISARGAGVHLIFPLPAEMSIGQAQRYYAEQLGLEQSFDSACSDPSRIGFVAGEDDILLPPDFSGLQPRPYSTRHEAVLALQPMAQATVSEDWPPSKGTQLISSWLETHGFAAGVSQPQRNNTLFKMTLSLHDRFPSPQAFIDSLPAGWCQGPFSSAEIIRTVRNAFAYSAKAGNPAYLKKKEEDEARRKIRALAEEQMQRLEEEQPMDLLPQELQQAIKRRIKPEFWSAAIILSLPFLGCLASRWRTWGGDGEAHEPTLFCVVEAPSGKGKDALFKLFNELIHPISQLDDKLLDKRDKLCAQREEKGKDTTNIPLYPRKVTLNTDASKAALFKANQYGNGLHLISIVPDMADILGAATWQNFREYIINSFDKTEMRVGFKGHIYKFIPRQNGAWGIQPKVRRRYLPSIDDGFAARFCWATPCVVEKSMKKRPKRQPRHDEDEKKPIWDFAQKVFNTSHYPDGSPKPETWVDLDFAVDKLEDWAGDMIEAYSDLIQLMDDQWGRYITFGTRAMLTLVATWGKKEFTRTEKKNIVRFGLWTAQYMMWHQFFIYGEPSDEKEAALTPQVHVGIRKREVLEALPETFTRKDVGKKLLEMGCSQQGKEDEYAKKLVNNWCASGWIEKTDRGQYKKVHKSVCLVAYAAVSTPQWEGLMTFCRHESLKWA